MTIITSINCIISNKSHGKDLLTILKGHLLDVMKAKYIIAGHVCFPEFTLWETIFQTFLCLFAIRKVGQRKTLSGQRKTLFSQRKIWFGFQENVFPFDCVCFSESGFRETTFQTFMCLFAIRKVGQRKTLSSQRKIWLGF